jgi:hypothetical protein
MATPVTPDDVLARLDAGTARLEAAITGLTDAQWTWRPDERTWSAALNIEHIVSVERGTVKLMGELFDTLEAVNFTPEQQAKRDGIVLGGVPNRALKIDAPAGVVPKGRYPVRADAIAQVRATRAALADAIRARGATLRTRCFAHPAFGKLDLLQWGLTCAEHSDRHLAQVAELATLPGYPA